MARRRCTHAAAFQDASSTAEVLLNQGADVHAKDNDGSTPLHHCGVTKDASATAEVLLKGGADCQRQRQQWLLRRYTMR